MKYAEEFRKFVDVRKRNPDRNCTLDDKKKLYEELEKLLKDYDDEGSEYKIDAYFSTNKNQKRSAQLIMIEFNKYLEKHNLEPFDGIPDLYSFRFHDTDTERKLVLLKELHNTSSVKKLAAKMKLKPRTIRSYINEFENGFEFLDTHIKVQVQRTSRKDYCLSTAHPIFMALNSTELHHLMTYLDKSSDPIVRSIGDLVYSQMSDYAKTYICPNVKDKFKTEVSDFIDEYKAMYNKDNIYKIGYLQKASSRRDTVYFPFEYWDDEDNRHRCKGSYLEDSYEDGICYLNIDTKEEGRIKLPADEVLFDFEKEFVYRKRFD